MISVFEINLENKKKSQRGHRPKVNSEQFITYCTMYIPVDQ